MSRTVVLDTGVLGLLVTPLARSADARNCRRWLADLETNRVRLIVPEICDYELRRELLRLRRARAVGELDALGLRLEYLGIVKKAMRRAAELWAFARQAGQPTAGDSTIDADMILVGQAETLGDPNTVIATTNVRHLPRFFPADLWSIITP
jgi:hypothetical protein